ESYKNDEIKNFIETNKNSIFHNLPTSTIVSSVVATYNKMQEGVIDLEITLSGKIYNNKGELVDASEASKYKVSLIGFKTTGLTTILKEKEISIKDINELSNQKASEIKNENDISTLKTKIKELVENSFLENQLEDIDIEITINSSNYSKGALDVKVKIQNSKTWANGVKEESKEFELKLVGFKIQAATEISNFEIKNLKKDILSKHYAIPYGKWNPNSTSTQEEPETDEKTHE
ncbi:MAG: hypothetical protein IKJ72_02960, partial [Mycoplasmataceae bacterium]|nr:hypothetical protein [Mycoplasmataceae bacterium]